MREVDHIALLVDDLDVSQEWYERTLGAECIFHDIHYRRMKVKNTTIALISKIRYPYNHIGILTECVEDLPSDGDRVEHRDGTIGVYTFDPDGHCIEHIWYNKECKKKVRNEDQ
jgi:catechol-2,3-dioxygenase